MKSNQFAYTYKTNYDIKFKDLIVVVLFYG